MRWIIDTNVWIDAMAGEQSAGRALKAATHDDWCGHSAISRLEVLSYSRLTEGEMTAFRAMLDQYVEVPIDNDVIEEAARLRRLVKVKAPDAIVAATALIRQAALITRNVDDFRRIPGLSSRSPDGF